MFSLAGRIALVTGASRGLGWGHAQALARAGATVVLNARDEALLMQRRATLEATGGSAAVAAFDNTDHEAATRAIERIVDEHGRLDILVANAGIAHRASLEQTSVEDFRRVMEIDLVAVWHLAKEAAKHMLPRGFGRIVLIGSVVGQVGRPTLSAYSAAKGAVHALTRELCAELGPHGITVNAIAPGYFDTELSAPLVADTEFSSWVCRRTPAGRWGRIEELGPATVFLASDEASFVNGQVLYVDGGLTAAM